MLEFLLSLPCKDSRVGSKIASDIGQNKVISEVAKLLYFYDIRTIFFRFCFGVV